MRLLGLIVKKFVTMHSHTNVKLITGSTASFPTLTFQHSQFTELFLSISMLYNSVKHNRYVTQTSVNLILTASISIQEVTDFKAVLTGIFSESLQSFHDNYKSIPWNIPRPLPQSFFFLLDLVFILFYLLVGLLILIIVCWAGCVLWFRLLHTKFYSYQLMHFLIKYVLVF